MKVRKLFLLIIILFVFSGCSNINTLTYDDVINKMDFKAKKSNVYKKGFSYYKPKGLMISNAGANYVILTDSNINYYLYVDFVSYMKKIDIKYNEDNNTIYSKKLNYDNKLGYLEIKKYENDKYLIEIVHNYAKIEVMVGEEYINKVLINSINILKSITYNDVVINRILDDNELSTKEEIFEMFENNKHNSGILEYEKDDEKENESDEIVDTDFIN